MEAASSQPNVSQQQQQQRLPVSESVTIGLRSRSGRVVFSPRQLDVLEQRFRGQRFLSKEERQQLATQLNLTDRQIMIWFQNRRYVQCHCSVIGISQIVVSINIVRRGSISHLLCKSVYCNHSIVNTSVAVSFPLSFYHPSIEVV